MTDSQRVFVFVRKGHGNQHIGRAGRHTSDARRPFHQDRVDTRLGVRQTDRRRGERVVRHGEPHDYDARGVGQSADTVVVPDADIQLQGHSRPDARGGCSVCRE